MINKKNTSTIERKWSQQLNDLIDEMTKRKKELIAEHSRLDKARSECLHFFELEHQSASVNAKVVRYLTDLSRERRKVKHEIADIDYTLSKIDNSKSINVTMERSYTYSDEFLERIFGDKE